jgi:hypothetical protein
MTLNDARIRIQIEYIEMPGLKLTLAQIGRLCGLSSEVCEPAVSLLVSHGFLAATRDGSFLRRGPAVDTVPSWANAGAEKDRGCW